MNCSIWDWKQQARLNRFSNGNPKGSKINEARFINEDDQALLMTGSSDGVIKIFRNYDSQKQVELVSAFRALTDLIPSTKNAGLVFDWQQGQGKVLVAGDVKVIKVWNAATEICTSVGNQQPCDSRHVLTTLGYSCSLRVMRHIFDIRPSSGQCFRRRFWRWCCACIRSTAQAGQCYGTGLEGA